MRSYVRNPLVVFAVTLFLSAAMLFIVELMIAKMILPKFGGTPAVWTTCTVFFQATLLAGYAYVHFMSTRVQPRTLIVTQVVILALPLVSFIPFPLGIYKGFDPPGDENNALWVLLLLVMLVGVPFFVVSTSAPLLQRWFSRTGHPAARDPYFLYAASNLGSMIGLLGYPLAIEPTIGLTAQGVFWMGGYAVLAGLSVYCAWMVAHAPPVAPELDTLAATTEAEEPAAAAVGEHAVTAQRPAAAFKGSRRERKARQRAVRGAERTAITAEPPPPEQETPTTPEEPILPPPPAGPPTLARLAWWTGLAFIPSSLMLGATTYLTTDIASLPLLWVIPLGLYLLSFILVFSSLDENLRRLAHAVFGPPPRRGAAVKAQPWGNHEWLWISVFSGVAFVLVLLVEMVLYQFVAVVGPLIDLQIPLLGWTATPVTQARLLYIFNGVLLSLMGLYVPLVRRLTSALAGPPPEEPPLPKEPGSEPGNTVWSLVKFGIHPTMVLLLPVLVLLLVFLINSGVDPKIWSQSDGIWLKFALHLVALFVIAMVCHGELARSRPATRYLTGYYLCMSAGGVLGGLCNALIAPVVFTNIAEYPLAIALACLFMPPLGGAKNRTNQGIDLGLALGLGGAGLYAAYRICLYSSPENPDGSRDLFLGLQTLTKSLLDAFHISNTTFLVLVATGLAITAWYAVAERKRWLERTLDVALPLALFVLSVELIRHTPFESKGPLAVVTDQLFWFSQTIGLTDEFGRRTMTDRLLLVLTFGLPVALCYGFAEQPIRFGLGVGAVLLAGACLPQRGQLIHQERSFFGVLRVEEDADTGVLYRRLLHGTTLHGMQNLDPYTVYPAYMLSPLGAATPFEGAVATSAAESARRQFLDEPLTYYHRSGPIGQAYGVLMDGPNAQRDVAFIGLGTGTMSSYANPGQTVTFYDIDPAVIRIASNPEYFTYLRDADQRGANVKFEVGDARLKLKQAANHKYHLIVVDAFSSDAIPIHLITKEAVELYLSKLDDDGVVAIHISNRHLRLAPVLGNIATDLKLAGRKQNDVTINLIAGRVADATAFGLAAGPGLTPVTALAARDAWKQFRAPGKSSSEWVVLAKNLKNLGAMGREWPWKPLPATDDRVWTDDYSNILSTLSVLLPDEDDPSVKKKFAPDPAK